MSDLYKQSLGLTDLNFIPTIDHRLNIKKLEQRKYAIETTAIQNTYKQFPITGASISNFSVTCNPPNNKVMIDSEFFLQFRFEMVFRGTSGGAGIHLLQAAGLPTAPGISAGNAYYDCPRAWPLSNALSNLEVRLNQDTNTTNLAQYIRALTRYHSRPANQDFYDSMTPTMLDQSQQYIDLNGFNRDPMRGYGDNDLATPRGGFINALITRNDSSGTANDVAIVQLNVMEPVILSPMNYGGANLKPAFIQLDTISISGNLGGRGNGTFFGSTVGALWSHKTPSVSPSVFSSIEVSVLDGSALFQNYTPPLTMEIPRTIVYDYSKANYQATQWQSPIPASPLPGSQIAIPISNIQLNSVPDRVYIWVSKRDVDCNMNDTDTFFSIDNININFDNQPGILATAQPTDLYKIALRNGCNSSFRQFRKDVGSVLCLKFGEDICMNNLISAGTRGSYNFDMTITCTNNSGVTITPTVSLLFVEIGTYTISEGVNTKALGLLTQNDVLRAQQRGLVPEPHPENVMDSMGMGGFKWSDVLNFFKRAGRTAIDIGKKIVPVLAPEFTPLVTGIDTAAKHLGFGKMRGGKQLTKAEMKKLLKEYEYEHGHKFP
jgi:hypothetical protein